jgi:hypothetical protein
MTTTPSSNAEEGRIRESNDFLVSFFKVAETRTPDALLSSEY